MNSINKFCNKPNTDCASIELGPLKMEVKKQFCTETPNEITAVVPRVEVREIIRGDLTYREYI